MFPSRRNTAREGFAQKKVSGTFRRSRLQRLLGWESSRHLFLGKAPLPPKPSILAHTQLIFCRNVQSDMSLRSEMSWPALANSLASGKLIFPRRRDHEWPCQVARWHLVTLWRGSTAGTKQEVDYVNSDSRLLGRIFGV